MKYSIHHKTSYHYSSPVSVCQNVVMLTPRSSPFLTCQTHRLTIRPTPSSTQTRIDAFGNHVNTLTIEESHTLLSITASSHVVLKDRQFSTDVQSPSIQELTQSLDLQTAKSWLDAAPFRFDSTRIRRGPLFTDYVQDLFQQRMPVRQMLEQLSYRIFNEFKYNKEATDVATPTETAFGLRAGVCQDFAHIAIACLRSIGIPARYVSGYLRTLSAPGKPRLVGADQSHAWVSAWCGDELGWVDFDPTNHCFCNTDHIPIAWGRDYSDVVPIRGVFLGAGEPLLQVSVDVCPESDG
jgi:transglutaminase-like putative cysteine protease